MPSDQRVPAASPLPRILWRCPHSAHQRLRGSSEVQVRVITDIVVKAAGRKGTGVFARRRFQAGEFIFRRRHGRVVANADIPLLSEDDRQHLCELDLETSAVLLPPGCFLNHSCDPNAMRSGVNVFAWRGILRGEEITIDYRLNAFASDRWRCLCESPQLFRRGNQHLFRYGPGAAAPVPPVRARLYQARVRAPSQFHIARS